MAQVAQFVPAKVLQKGQGKKRRPPVETDAPDGLPLLPRKAVFLNNGQKADLPAAIVFGSGSEQAEKLCGQSSGPALHGEGSVVRCAVLCLLPAISLWLAFAADRSVDLTLARSCATTPA